MPRRLLFKLYEKAVDALSFSSELYKLRRDLNARIDQPETIQPDLRSHPLGVARWFKKRRISIAEAYLMVLRDLDSRHASQRLRALRMMTDASFHTQALDIPLNTARVQMALIKEAVKSREDRRRQLELLQDFSASTRGQAQTIRRLLDWMGLVELPETGKRLKDSGAGWDFHVHDTATLGRKNPTQLLIDAFIKGISELAIAYNGIGAEDLMGEAIEAGRILGIKVNIGMELGLDFEGERFHFMALLPEMRRAADLRRFFEENRKALKPLLTGLEKDQAYRIDSIRKLLAAFNEDPLRELNSGFPDKRFYRVPKLRMKAFAAFVPLRNANRAHLGEFLWKYYKPVMLARVLYLKAQRGLARRDGKNGLISELDLEKIESRYSSAREEFRAMNPESLKKRYFPEPAEAGHDSTFDDLAGLKHTLAHAGCALKLLHPLEHGFDKAARLIEAGRGKIDQIEVYNIRDCLGRDGEEVLRLCRFVGEENRIRVREGKHPFRPVCGSDSTGRNPELPGMGFVRGDRLKGKYRARYRRRHIALPDAVSRLIFSEGRPAEPGRPLKENPEILCMGKVAEPWENRLGDEEDGTEKAVPLSRAVRYLNPGLANLLMTAFGFLVADLSIGPLYACVWLGITGFRVAIADLLAVRGTRIRQWHARSVSWDNVARALFWTGFSVPIMGFIKARFDLIWPLAETGLLRDAAKFFLISFANGLYIACHNKFRGFDPKVIRANFFRTIISWPFATAFSPLGNSLGLPSIVQSKIWSDVVAGFIEGGGKFFKTLRLRRRDAEELVPRIVEGRKEERAIAVLDLLFLFREEPRTVDSLKAFLRVEGEIERFEKVISDGRLDRFLVDYAIGRHVREVAVDLVRLISETLPELRDWLQELSRGKKAFPRQRGAS